MGLACVVMQRGKSIRYASRQLKPHEKNNPTYELDLSSMVFSLKIWRHYLYEVDVDVFTYHKSLQYVFTQKDLNLRERRWLELLKDYHMSLLYHTRKVNAVADALSRVSMGCVTNVVDDKKLVKEVHKLAHLDFRIEDSPRVVSLFSRTPSHL